MGGCLSFFCKSLPSLAKISWELAEITKTSVFMRLTGHRQGLDYTHRNWRYTLKTALRISRESLKSHSFWRIFVGFCVLGSIVVSIPACHAGDRGSIPRRGGYFWALLDGWPMSFYFTTSNDILAHIAFLCKLSKVMLNLLQHTYISVVHSVTKEKND